MIDPAAYLLYLLLARVHALVQALDQLSGAEDPLLQNIRIRLNTQGDPIHSLHHICKLEHVHVLLLLEPAAQGFQSFEQPGRNLLKAHQQAVARRFPIQQIPCQVTLQSGAAVADPSKVTSPRQQILDELLQLYQRVNQAVPFRVSALGTVQNQGFEKPNRNRIPVRP